MRFSKLSEHRLTESLAGLPRPARLGLRWEVSGPSSAGEKSARSARSRSAGSSAGWPSSRANPSARSSGNQRQSAKSHRRSARVRNAVSRGGARLGFPRQPGPGRTAPAALRPAGGHYPARPSPGPGAPGDIRPSRSPATVPAAGADSESRRAHPSAGPRSFRSQAGSSWHQACCHGLRPQRTEEQGVRHAVCVAAAKAETLDEMPEKTYFQKKINLGRRRPR